MTFEISIGPNSRESAESRRWSPKTRRSPSGTSHPADPHRRVGRLGHAVVLVDVGLVELRVVHEDLAVPQLHVVAGQADDPLDERHAVAGRPARRRVEDDDVAAGVGRPVRRQLVDEDVLVGQQRRLHRALLDLVRLRDERLDAEEDDEGQDESLDHLEQATERGSLGHKSGAVSLSGRTGPG